MLLHECLPLSQQPLLLTVSVLHRIQLVAQFGSLELQIPYLIVLGQQLSLVRFVLIGQSPLKLLPLF